MFDTYASRSAELNAVIKLMKETLSDEELEVVGQFAEEIAEQRELLERIESNEAVLEWWNR